MYYIVASFVFINTSWRDKLYPWWEDAILPSHEQNMALLHYGNGSAARNQYGNGSAAMWMVIIWRVTRCCVITHSEEMQQFCRSSAFPQLRSCSLWVQFPIFRNDDDRSLFEEYNNVHLPYYIIHWRNFLKLGTWTSATNDAEYPTQNAWRSFLFLTYFSESNFGRSWRLWYTVRQFQ